MKVCKFGGTSLASAKTIESVKKIILSDKDRKFIVVSAPGKSGTEEKVTDLLYRAYEEAKKTGSLGETFSIIENRFKKIIRELNLDLNLSKEFKDAKKTIEKDLSEDFAASRGEYFCAKILAKYLGFQFIDAKDIIFFNEDGSFNAEQTNKICAEVLQKCKKAVIPGFYGICKDKIKTFSRGGSDITGAIIARAASAEVYENWTDVNGFMTADPRIVNNPKPIKMLSYNELRELSYMGASVLHSESIFPVKVGGIPINIRNTFDPKNSGTMIVPESLYSEQEYIITGIAGKKDFSIIFIDEPLMNSKRGFVRKVLSIVEEAGVSFEHIPTGIDTMSLVIEDKELEGRKLDKIVKKIKKEINPENISVEDRLAIIAIVGHGMQTKVGTAAKLFTAIANAGINVRMIDQGSGELNIIVGVNNDDYEKCIKAIYNEFFKSDL